MKPETLSTLLAGHFVCQYAFPDAYADLTETGHADAVNQWLGSLDRRLARLGDDGAFFVAPMGVHTSEHIAKVKGDLARFRETYGLLTEMLNLVRMAKEGFRGVPGDYVQLADLVLLVNEDSTLVARLRELRIPGADARMSNHEVLRRMLEKLKVEGYLVLTNPSTEMYQLTGRVDHLHAVLRYLVEHVPELSDTSLQDIEGAADDLEESQGDLLADSAALNRGWDEDKGADSGVNLDAGEADDRRDDKRGEQQNHRPNDTESPT